MQGALSDASAEVEIVEQQVAKQGITGITDQQWRTRMRQTRIETARNGMTAVMQEIGSTVNTYFSPEERLSFVSFAEAKRKDMDIPDVEMFAIPLAQSATLADQEARLRFEVAMNQAHPNGRYYAQMEALIDLQRRRGRFPELAGQMELLASVLPAGPTDLRREPLLAAVDAYKSDGDTSNEFRLLRSVFSVSYGLDDVHQQRFFELLLGRDPDELVRIAGTWNQVGEKATEFVLANGSPSLSHAVVQARARIRPAVWSKFYNALIGLYFNERTAEVKNAFVAALGDSTIGERLATRIDRSQQLAGGVWFYYGSRYGDYLGSTKQGEAEDFLPALVEEGPATAANYLTLADYYMGAGDTKRAIEEYEHTLDLAPSRVDAYDDLAAAYYKQGDRTAALARWKQALSELLKEINSPRVPETFWRDFGHTCDQLRARHLFPELKPDAESIIRTYLRHNGSWRSNAVLQPAYLAAGDPGTVTQWLVDLSSSATDPTQVLADVADASWIPLAQRALIYQRILELKATASAKLAGMEHDSAQQEFGEWQVRWIQYLVRTKQFVQAADALAALPAATPNAQSASLVVLDLRIAAQLGALDAKIAGYRSIPEDVPQSNLLRTAARQLFEAGDKQSARKILEFVFAHEIDEHQLVASNFLGLAEIRIASGDMPGALDLLHRLVAVVGNPFENLDPAAALLEKTGHNAEAAEFLDQLVKSAPWNASYRLRLAKAKLAAGQDAGSAADALTAIAAGTNKTYDLRSKAALTLASKAHSDLGSAELNLLAGTSSSAPATAADNFYFYEARIKAARNTPDQQLKMQLLSHCIIDFPPRDEARFPLFEAAVATHSDEFAMAIVQPIFRGQYADTYGQQNENEDEQIISSDTDPETDEGQGEAQIQIGSKLSRSHEIEVAQTVGDILLRFKLPSQALPNFQVAWRLETSAAKRKLLDKKIAAVRATLRLQQQNAARQPILHEALEQDRLVRPRLLALAAPLTVPASKGGVKQ